MQVQADEYMAACGLSNLSGRKGRGFVPPPPPPLPPPPPMPMPMLVGPPPGASAAMQAEVDRIKALVATGQYEAYAPPPGGTCDPTFTPTSMPDGSIVCLRKKPEAPLPAPVPVPALAPPPPAPVYSGGGGGGGGGGGSWGGGGGVEEAPVSGPQGGEEAGGEEGEEGEGGRTAREPQPSRSIPPVVIVGGLAILGGGVWWFLKSRAVAQATVQAGGQPQRASAVVGGRP